jgi:hypothetical protein
MVVSFSDRTEQQLMRQLLDFEQQLLARSLKLVKHLHQQHAAGAEDDQLTGLISMPQLLAAAHTETGRIRRYGGALSGMAVQMLSLPPSGASAEMAAARQLLRLAASICVQATRDSDLVARREEDVSIATARHAIVGADELAPCCRHWASQRPARCRRCHCAYASASVPCVTMNTRPTPC